MYDVSKRASLPMERNRARRPRRKQEEKLCQLSKNSGSTATTTIQSDPNFSLTCFLLLSALLVFLQYTSKETLFLLAITMGVLKNLTLSLALASTAFGFAPKISPGHQIGVLKVRNENACHFLGFVYERLCLTRPMTLFPHRRPRKVKYYSAIWMVRMFESVSSAPDGTTSM